MTNSFDDTISKIDPTTATVVATITVGDVELPDGVTATADSELPVVTVLTMRTPVLDAEEAAAEEAAAEGEAGDGADDGSDAADSDSE